MKKTKLLGILLAGVMSVTGVPYIAQPLTTAASAEDKLPAPKVTVVHVSSEYASLRWDIVKGADAYRVLKYNSKSDKYITVSETRSNECYISGLNPKTTYKFKVVALRSTGNGYAEQTRSDVMTVTTKGIEAPRNISVSVTSDSVTLSWSSSYKSAAYRIYRYNSKKGKFVKYKDVTATQCTIGGLTEGKTYKFRIAALSKSGDKYVAQEQTPVIIAFPTKGEPLVIPDFPKYGVDCTEALKFMGATSYTISEYEYDGTAYTLGGGALLSGDGISLLFNEKGEYYGVMMIKTTLTNDKEMLAALRKKNGEPKLFKDHGTDMYVWTTNDDIKLSAFASGYFAYVEISRKYSPAEMMQSLAEYMKKSEKASSEV
ncbi:MAG: fibronectin type III domain-containing protein [Ruminiclostridium sp.]|nr:fibronectin type III domain-containing protein [Ruminiclostridium sp.]